MTKKSILEVRIGGLESILSCNHMHIGELEPELASRSLELDAATKELEPTKIRSRFAKNAVSHMHVQGQSQGLVLASWKRLV